MKIAIAADHGGFPIKDELTQLLRSMGHDVQDLGAHQLEPTDDYPDYARYIGQAIQNGHADRGILLCGSGVGASVAANKMKGIRAGLFLRLDYRMPQESITPVKSPTHVSSSIKEPLL